MTEICASLSGALLEVHYNTAVQSVVTRCISRRRNDNYTRLSSTVSSERSAVAAAGGRVADDSGQNCRHYAHRRV